jgi:hypothetical protein
MVANPVVSAVSTTMPSYASVVAGTVSVGVASPVLSVIDAGPVSVSATATATLAADLASAIDPSVCAVRNRLVPMTFNPTAKVGAKSQSRKPKSIFLDSLAPAEWSGPAKTKKIVKSSQQVTVDLSAKIGNRVTGKPPVKAGKIVKSLKSLGRSYRRSFKSAELVVDSDEEEDEVFIISDDEGAKSERESKANNALPVKDLRDLIDPAFDVRKVIDQAFDNQPKYDIVYFFTKGRKSVRKSVYVVRSKPMDSGRIKLFLNCPGENNTKIIPAESIKNSKLTKSIPKIFEREVNWPQNILTFQRDVMSRPATLKNKIGRINIGDNKIALNYFCLDISKDCNLVPKDDNPKDLKALNEKEPKMIYAFTAGDGEEPDNEEGEATEPKSYSRPRITKLNETNYHSWRTTMSVTLEAMRMWNIEKELPKSGRDSWREIMLAVSDSQHVTIEKTKDGLEAWKALAKHHEKSGIASVLSELRRFFLTKFEGGTLAEHCADLISAQRKLDRLGHPIDDTIVVAVLLNSLPDKYEPMIYAWDAIGEKLKLDDVVSKLVNMPEKEDQQFAGLSAKDLSQVKCYECGKLGHFARDCRDKNKNRNFKSKGNFRRKPSPESGNSAKSEPSKDDKIDKKDDLSWGLAASEFKSDDSEWILDSGASQHLSGTKSYLSDIQPTSKSIRVVIADGTELKATHVGNLKVKGLGTVFGVYYTPGLETNMLSIAKLSENGCNIQFNGSNCIITKDDMKFTCDRNNGMYRVYAYSATVSDKTRNEEKSKATELSLNKVHEIMGHVHTGILKEMIKNGQLKIWKVDPKEVTDPCSICLKGKLVRNNIPTESTSNTTQVGMLIHSDVWGPAQKETHQGYLYYVIFIDDYSRYCVLFLLKKKSEVFAAFKTFAQLMKTQLNVSIKKLRSDNGGEYTSQEFRKYCQELGIQQQFTTAHSSFQNGVAERQNRTLLEGTRCLLIGGNLNKSFWGEGVTHMNLLRNIILKKGEEKTPFEKFHGTPPNYSNLYTFGTIVYVHKPDQKKLDHQGAKGLYMGKDPNRKAIKVWIVDRKKIISTRDFKILPKSLSIEREQSPISGKGENKYVPDIEDRINEENDKSNEEMTDEETESSDEETEKVSKTEAQEESEEEFYYSGSDSEITESKKENSETRPDPKSAESEEEIFHHPTAGKWKMSDQKLKWDLSDLPEKRARSAKTYGMAAEVKIPIQEAFADPKWLEAMNSEMESQQSKATWKLVKRPQEKKVLKCRWIYVIKKNLDQEKFKARLVVGGHKQTFGIDYEETFAPVVKYQSIRILLALATVHDWEVHQMDFVTAFLNATLSEEIYMEQPPGYTNENPDDVCLLIKGLYGLKQSPRVWNKKYKDIMEELGFVCITADESVYVNESLIVGVYVDDLIIVSPHLEKIEKFKKDIKKKYDVKDLGELSLILSMRWTRNRGERISFLSQETYANEIVERFSMSDCKPVATPGVNLETPEDEKKSFKSKTLYMQACGSLSHLQNCTRPDITFAVGMICRKMQDPTEHDWMAVKRILRYVKGTATFGIKFGSDTVKVTGYGDADWAGCHESRRSTSGYVFLMGQGAVAWASKKQQVIALSSVEAEYISGSLAVQEAIWENKFLEEIGIKTNKPLLHQDNQGTIALANNPIQHARTKHIDVRHYFMKDAVQKNLVTLQYCPTQEMVADVLTKHLGRVKFEEFRKSMGIVAKL